MDVKDYCNNMQLELNTWKARLFDIIYKIDKVSEADRNKMAGDVKSLQDIVCDLDERVDRLRTDCPTEYESQRGEISAKVGALSDKYEDLWHYPGLGDSSKPAA